MLLGDILRAALQIATGGRRAVFSFENEPGEWRWIVERLFEHKTHRYYFMIRIVTFASGTVMTNAAKPDHQGTVAFEAECEPDDFARAALAMGRDVLQRYGMDGYNKRWSTYVFPLRSLCALEAALNTHDPPPGDRSSDTAGGWIIYAPGGKIPDSKNE
jgi:hypothetical protein